jgi:hypothetical protein
MQFAFSAHPHTPSRVYRPPQSLPPLTAHYTDANEAEIAADKESLDQIESAFGLETQLRSEFAVTAFVDFLVDARKLERQDDGEPIFEIANFDFPLSDVLTHLTPQRWPLPNRNTCPCSFCDETIELRSIDAHLELMHGAIFQWDLH